MSAYYEGGRLRGYWKDGYWKGEMVDGYPADYFKNGRLEYPWEKDSKKGGNDEKVRTDKDT